MNFEDPKQRIRVYFAAALVCFVAAFAMLSLRSIGRDHPLSFPNGNGLGYYMYLPSLVIDGDLDFRNQALISYGEEPPVWVVSGRYPMGVALSLIPTFLVAHALSSTIHAATGSSTFAPDGFTILYQILNLMGIYAIWITAMTLMDRLLCRRFAFSGATTLGAILLFWMTSYAFWYLVRSPFWAHVTSTAWLIIALFVFDRVLADSDRGKVTWRLPLLGLVMSLAVLCRLTDIFMAPFGLYLAFHLYRSGLLQKALRQVPLILLAVSPVLIQLLIWAAAAGGGIPKTPEEIGYIEKERFFWTQPVLLLPLFSSLQGLFFYSPILLWSAWGLAWGTLQRGVWRDPLFLCLVCSALALWYINGCWYAWWFGGDAFGARAFLELGGLYILGFAFALDHLRKCSFRARVPIATAATCAILVGYGLMGTRAINVMPSRTDTFLFAWERERFAHTLARARLERPSNASSELPSR